MWRIAYEINDGYFYIQTSEDGYDYTLYSKDFTVMDGGIVETDEYRPVQEVMEEVLAEHGHSVSECGVISAEYLQEQSYRAETQRAEAMKEKLAAEKPAPEASISFYVAECAEFPVMGEFHDNLTLEQALEVYDKIPAERMNGIKSIGFSLEDGSIYSGMFGPDGRWRSAGRNRQPYPALPGKSAGAESNFGYENAFGKAAGKQGVRGTPQHPAVCS